MIGEKNTTENPQTECSRLFSEVLSRIERIKALGGKIGLPVLVDAKRGNEVFEVIAEELFFLKPDDIKPFSIND